jgi:hypothetical protein
MREYKPQCPLEVLDTFYYPNLLKDSNNEVMSENIAYFVLHETEDLKELLEGIESQARKLLKKIEIGYHDSSGNRWIFLILNGKQNENNLRSMQAVYRKLYRRRNQSVRSKHS